MAQVAGFAWIPLDISDFPTRHNYGLALWQNHIERILAGWVDELAVPIYRGREVTGFAQDDTGVDVELSDGPSLRAEYLVGCDGGRSLIRKAAGIEFPGWDPTISHLIAEVELAEEPEWGIRRDALGIHGLSRVEYEIRDGEMVYADRGPVRVMVTEQRRRTDRRTHPARSQRGARRRLRDRFRDPQSHLDLPVHRYGSAGRVLPQGTGAAGGRRRPRALPGGRTGPQHRCAGCGEPGVEAGPGRQADVAGQPPRYLPCRAAPGRRPVLRNTMAQVALLRTDDRTNALREIASELLSMDEPRKRFAAMMSGLDIHYDLGEGHPLLGRRMPDLDLVTADGPLRVFTLLHDARPVLLNLGEPGGLDITPWADRVQADRRHVCRYVGASGPGPRRGPRRRADPTRWLRRLGGGRHRYRIARRADDLVRVTVTRRDARPNRTPNGGDVDSPTRSSSSTPRPCYRRANTDCKCKYRGAILK